MRLLITGGCGFIGANLTRLLVRSRFEARVLDDLSVGTRHALPEGVELIEGSVLDSEALREAARGVDGVVHLAAQTGVIASIEDPLADFEKNARGTLLALLAAKGAGARVFVLASSNACLGDATPPVHEEMATRPLSPYGASKLAGEAYLSAFHGSYGLRTVALRFANAYGPWSTHKTSVVAQFFQDAAIRRRLRIYGDGRQTRDFVHAADVASAILAAVQRGQGGGVYHVGTGHETSVAWLAARVAALVGGDVRVEHLPARTGEVARTFVDARRAHREIGFRARVDLAEGLRATWEWLRDRVPSGLAVAAATTDDPAPGSRA